MCANCLLALGLPSGGAGDGEAGARLESGSRLGPYEIAALLGAGGMGEVYRARDVRLGREVAIKVPAAALIVDALAVDRFEREVRSVAALSHPNLVTLHDVGSEDGIPYAVSELLAGANLRRLLARGPLPPARVLDLALQVARGVAAAHRKGIVHRDLKPENVFVTEAGQAKVLDFGLAGVAAADGTTAVDSTLGTPGYMSPEQLRGLPVGPSSDVYALGTTLYEMLAGRRPFVDAAGKAAIDTSAAADPAALGLADDLGRELEKVVRHCLVNDPEQRFASAEDLVTALEAVQRVHGSGGGELEPTGAERLDAHAAFRRAEAEVATLGDSDPAALRRAIGWYEQAVGGDPAFALAWAQLARVCALLSFVSSPSPALAERARLAADRAAALAPELPATFLALGDHLRWVCKDARRALEHYRRGLLRAPRSAEHLASIALAEQGLGLWQEAEEHLRAAEAVDPDSVTCKRRLGYGMLCLRRHGEARAVFQGGLRVAPENVALHGYLVQTALAEGDLASANAVFVDAPPALDRVTLALYLARWDLVWAVPPTLRLRLETTGVDAFDGDRGRWALALAEARALADDVEGARTAAEIARQSFEEQLRVTPADARSHVSLATALARLGQRRAAVHETERAIAFLPVEEDAYSGPFLQHRTARVLALAGEPDAAIDRLRALLTIPYVLSPGWLRIDPGFAALREHPRFRALVEPVAQSPDGGVTASDGTRFRR